MAGEDIPEDEHELQAPARRRYSEAQREAAGRRAGELLVAALDSAIMPDPSGPACFNEGTVEDALAHWKRCPRRHRFMQCGSCYMVFGYKAGADRHRKSSPECGGGTDGRV